MAKANPGKNLLGTLDIGYTRRLLPFLLFVLILDGLLFSAVTMVEMSGFAQEEWSFWAIPSLFALGCSQLVSVVVWKCRGPIQLVKWVAVVGLMVGFSLWLGLHLESGWNQAWMVCCLLVVLSRLIWALIDGQRADRAKELRIEQYQKSSEKVRFQLWNFLDWTIAAGMFLSVCGLVYQNMVASILPMIGLVAFAFVSCLSRLAVVIVHQNLQKRQEIGVSGGLLWDSAGTAGILLAVNIGCYFWLSTSLATFYGQAVNLIFVMAIVTQVWQIIDGWAECRISHGLPLFRVGSSQPAFSKRSVTASV